jgi:GTP-binding protein
MPPPPAPPPRVAIVGRPNVGKSRLLNALVGSRIAIVEPTPGVTRDRVGVLATVAGRTVEVVDTGGVGIVDRIGLDAEIERQVRAAVEGAAAVLFVVDAREGRAPLDDRVATLLRPHAARVVLVANKVESEGVGWEVAEFEALGYGAAVPVSAQNRWGLEALTERLDVLLPKGEAFELRAPSPDLRLAVVGRVNAGKSSLVNALLRDERMIVSEVPGTTRDSVDLRLERDGRSIVLIDTAGIRKERSVQGSLEFYAQRRAEKAMRRADVTVLVLDATMEVGSLDRRIAGYAVRHHQPVVLVVNKWDLVRGESKPGDFVRYLSRTLSGVAYAPIVFTSALTGHNVDKVLEVAQRLHEQAQARVPTAELNRVVEAAYDLRKPRPRHGRMGRVYYGSQVDVAPPTFVLFVNDPALFEGAWLRFFENRVREQLPMSEIPVRVVLRARTRVED